MGGAGNKGIQQDNSIYWHPALYMKAIDGSGYIRVPTNGHKLYYKNAGTGTMASPFEFPKGFRMLAGSPFMRKAATDLQQQNITQWICHHDGGKMNQGTDGGFPTGVQNCADYDSFNGALHFPHCWNGADFDPANPSAHVVYPTGDIENGACPSSHPTRLPHIFAENTFDMPKVYGKVVPDSFVLAQGDNTGYGWHADFYNGWEEGAIPAILNSCPYNEYGNEDAGICTSFQQRATNPDQCKLAVSYSENVDTPGQFLPGCNPIIDTNPAPIQPIAAINVATNVCGAGGTAPTSTTPSSSVPASSSSAPASTYSSSQASVPASSTPTTLSSKISSATPSSSAVASSSPASSVVKAPTSSASSPASTSTSISCPASNGTIFVASNGDQFQIECGIDHHSGDMGSKTTHGLAACIAACASTPGCVDVSLSGVACYMKSSLGATEINGGVNGAKLVSSSTKRKQKAKQKVFGHTTTLSETNVVYVTDYVTVTATPAPLKVRHAHIHARHDAKAAAV